MKHNKTKKTFLGVGSAVMTPAMVMMVEGKFLEGGILMTIGVGMILAYDHLDDKAKGNLPAGVDAKTVEQVAETAADEIKEATDKNKKQ